MQKIGGMEFFENSIILFKKILSLLIILTICCSILYGIYWVTKTVSYSVFYEDMVVRTIVKNVKPEALK